MALRLWGQSQAVLPVQRVLQRTPMHVPHSYATLSRAGAPAGSSPAASSGTRATRTKSSPRRNHVKAGHAEDRSLPQHGARAIRPIRTRTARTVDRSPRPSTEPATDLPRFFVGSARAEWPHFVVGLASRRRRGVFFGGIPMVTPRTGVRSGSLLRGELSEVAR